MSNHENPRGPRLRGVVLSAAAALAGLMTLAACGSSGSTAASSASGTPPSAGSATSASAAPANGQAPVATGSNPPGDIPDTTLYVAYRSAPGHLLVKVPEGWSRKAAPIGAVFASNLNTIAVSWLPMKAAPTVASVRATTIRSLQMHALAFRLRSVRAVSLAGGPAVETVYEVNSPPNPVTGRQYRLVIERFELYHHGQGAVLSLSSAVGSDNVDPWRKVSESFRWM